MAQVVTKEQALEALAILRKQAKEKGLQDLTLDEINEEIRLARQLFKIES